MKPELEIPVSDESQVASPCGVAAWSANDACWQEHEPSLRPAGPPEPEPWGEGVCWRD